MSKDHDVIVSAAWPAKRLGELIERLSSKANLWSGSQPPVTPPDGLEKQPPEIVGRWIMACAQNIGLEVEPYETPYSELLGMLQTAGPAILQLEGAPVNYLALLRSDKRFAYLLSTELSLVKVPLLSLRQFLVSHLEAPYSVGLDQLLQSAGVPEKRKAKAKEAILQKRLVNVRVAKTWLLRTPPSASFWKQCTQIRIPRRITILFAAHIAQYTFSLASWWMIGRGILQGKLDQGWLWAWALLLLTMIPFQLLGSWTQGMLAIEAGRLLKQRMLMGALKLQPEEIRSQGAGQLLGRVVESEAVESLSLTGGFVGVLSVIELIMAIFILSAGAGGLLHVVLLLGWIFLAAIAAWRYAKLRTDWSDVRIDMTNDLVERMVGHRTRLAQEQRASWHEIEDQSVEEYANISKKLDTSSIGFNALIPRGWLLIGLLGLMPAFLSGGASQVGFIISIGGILFAQGAIQKLIQGSSALIGVSIAWRQVGPLFHAASRQETPGSPTFALAMPAKHRVNRETLIEAREIVFRYRDRGEPVLKGANLSIHMGDRLLFEGPSGGGKSTFASLLIGLRQPESGLLLLSGLDRQTLGAEGWRQRVVSAPQFHENHVLTETFGFNLLMGRGWPPSPEDLQEAEAVCRELDLGPLLDRMPAGMMQMVGETGWQLSHGEKSRLFLARALLQGADLIILDESFAALDPETLSRALQCTLKRAKTLVVIAHP
jgi:ATP-binding cassette subfamily B protein